MGTDKTTFAVVLCCGATGSDRVRMRGFTRVLSYYSSSTKCW
jgi:hypothetical protein